MNLSQLYYFVKLSELQHYTKAAKELYITQPSLSAAISSLENELGVSLFQKKGRNIVLTKHGEEFYTYVSNSLNELERGITVMKSHSGGMEGTIKVGCIPTLIGDFLPNSIHGYNEKYPKVHFNVFQGRSRDIVNNISSGNYNIGFCSKVDEAKDLNFVPIMSQEIVIIVNDKHKLANTKKFTLNDIKDYNFITYRTSIPIGKEINSILNKNDIKANYLYDDEISIGGAVSATDTIGIVANTSFLKQFDNLVKIPITDMPKDTRLIYMVFSKKNYIESSVEVFADFIIANKLNLP